MADLYRASDDVSTDSTEQTNQAFKAEFSEDEETLITRMYNLVGERIPGRTAEEIEEYWTSRCSTGE